MYTFTFYRDPEEERIWRERHERMVAMNRARAGRKRPRDPDAGPTEKELREQENKRILDALVDFVSKLENVETFSSHELAQVLAKRYGIGDKDGNPIFAGRIAAIINGRGGEFFDKYFAMYSFTRHNQKWWRFYPNSTWRAENREEMRKSVEEKTPFERIVDFLAGIREPLRCRATELVSFLRDQDRDDAFRFLTPNGLKKIVWEKMGDFLKEKYGFRTTRSRGNTYWHFSPLKEESQ